MNNNVKAATKVKDPVQVQRMLAAVDVKRPAAFKNTVNLVPGSDFLTLLQLGYRCGSCAVVGPPCGVGVWGWAQRATHSSAAGVVTCCISTSSGVCIRQLVLADANC